MGRPLKYNEMPLVSVNSILTFEIWPIDFVGPFPNPAQRTGARYIITYVDYVTKWDILESIGSHTKDVDAKFIYEKIITRLGFPLTLISDRGTHFINQTI